MTGMNVDEAKAASSELLTQATNLDDLVSRVSSLAGPLAECWTGADSDACNEFLAKLSQDMTDMSAEILKIRAWIDQTAENYEDHATSGAGYYGQSC